VTNLTLAATTSAPLDLAAALAALERGGAITPISLDLEDPEMSYEAWIGLGEVFRRVRGASSWWIGDWYIFGCIAKSIGEGRAAAAESVVGLSPHTLATIVRTCMYVPKNQRNLNLPFSHHTEVARLMPEEQSKWLSLAEQGDGRSSWSREQLREAIQFSRKRYSDTEPHWEGAVAMKRDNDVISAANSIWEYAVMVGDHYVVPGSVMRELGVALGQVLEGTKEGVAA
jgi:hypothetical protein